MSRSNRKSKGYWRGKPYKDYENCYKGFVFNEADSIFVIHNRRVYFQYQHAYCLHSHQNYLVLGPEVTEDTLASAELHGCL